MEKQISIIIPTYNMEEYLAKCLDSLIVPCFDKVEVLVINDGSKDSSSEIAHSYADRYPNSIRVIDKPNGNYGSCINAALPLATGRYIKILDADDSFDTASFCQFVKEIERSTEDVVISQTICIDENGKELTNLRCPNFGLKGTKSFDLEHAKKYLLTAYIPMHCISYAKNVFSRFHYFQTEGVSYTDTQWASIPVSYCESFKWTNFLVYRYLCGRSGQTMSAEQIKKSSTHFEKLTNSFLDFLSEHSETQFHSEILRGHIGIHIKGFYNQMFRNITPKAALVIKTLDKRILENFPWLYEATNALEYSNEVKYKFVAAFRKKNSPLDYHFPYYVRFSHAIIFKFKQFFRLR